MENLSFGLTICPNICQFHWALTRHISSIDRRGGDPTLIVHRCRRFFYFLVQLRFILTLQEGGRRREASILYIYIYTVAWLFVPGVYLIYFYLHLHSQVQAPPVPKKDKYLSDGNGNKNWNGNRPGSGTHRVESQESRDGADQFYWLDNGPVSFGASERRWGNRRSSAFSLRHREENRRRRL